MSRYSVIIGMDSLDDLGVFTANSHALVANTDQTGLSELNSIRSRGRIDEVMSWFKKMVHKRAPPGDIMGK